MLPCVFNIGALMSRAIVTYADGAHEELLEVALLSYRAFADRHGYLLHAARGGDVDSRLPPAWNKVLLMAAMVAAGHDEVVWFDCDLVVVDPTNDFPPMEVGKSHALVRHFEDYSEVPNTGVWRVTKDCISLLQDMLGLEVFHNHGWWEQAALMTLMGYTVPPEGSQFNEIKCKNVVKTTWYNKCQFMRLCWNSHPNYQAVRPRIVHCSYPNMTQRLAVMQELARNPAFEYPAYDQCPVCKRTTKEVKE